MWVPKIQTLAQVWGRWGDILQVIVTRTIVDRCLAVAIAVTVTTIPYSVACETYFFYKLQFSHIFLWLTILIFLSILVKRFSILVCLVPPLHFLHLSSLILEPNLDNSDRQPGVLGKGLSHLGGRKCRFNCLCFPLGYGSLSNKSLLYKFLSYVSLIR